MNGREAAGRQMMADLGLGGGGPEAGVPPEGGTNPMEEFDMALSTIEGAVQSLGPELAQEAMPHVEALREIAGRSAGAAAGEEGEMPATAPPQAPEAGVERGAAL